MQNIYLMLTIIKRNEANEFSSFFLEHGAAPIYATICQGATSSETLSILGLEECEKLMLQSIVSHDKMKKLNYALVRDMSIDLPGKGISLSIPLSSIASRRVLDNIIKEESTSVANVSDNFENNERKLNMELIISICSKGNTDGIMKAARAEGATGGTIVKAKGTASAGTDKFFGMSISDEKELVYIVSKKELRNGIMKAIASYTEKDADTHPVVFSLPITDTAGFRFFD